jgi:hypothetical protein
VLLRHVLVHRVQHLCDFWAQVIADSCFDAAIAGLLSTIAQASRSVTAQLHAAMPQPSPSNISSSSRIVGVLTKPAASTVLDVCMGTFKQLHLLWPGSAPLTAAALRPCFQPVVELAWTVLEAGAAAGMFAGSKSISISNLWQYQFANALDLAESLAQTLGDATRLDDQLRQWTPHAQQFASNALLKLLMMVAGIYVGDQCRQQQQQQQQGKQVYVQPYHQQLLAELKMQPSEKLIDSVPSTTRDTYGTLYACAALYFAMEMRIAVQQDGCSSSSSSGESTGVGATAQPAAAAAAAVAPGISSRLHELALLTMLEFAIVSPAADLQCMRSMLAYCVDVQQLVIEMHCSDDAAAGVPSNQQLSAFPASDALLQCLLLESTPAVLRRVRSVTAASSVAAAETAVASSDGSFVSAGHLMNLLALLSGPMLQVGELRAMCSMFRCCCSVFITCWVL